MDRAEFSVTAEQLLPIRERFVLVDVRETEEWEEGHIPGATHIPLGEIPSRGARELDPDAEIVLYCAHGVRSVYALMALRERGFEKLKSLDGGIVAWAEHGGSVV